MQCHCRTQVFREGSGMEEDNSACSPHELLARSGWWAHPQTHTAHQQAMNDTCVCQSGRKQCRILTSKS